MAGDWVKIRSTLLSHPKVLAIAKALCADRSFVEWLAGDAPRTGADHALEVVTFGVVTRVTLASLHALWACARESGDPDGNDAVLPHMDEFSVDELVGVPGFAAACSAVGWVRFEVNPDRAVLPNFLSHNDIPDRSGAKSGRERTAAWRARKSRDETVTLVTKCDGRAEQSRAEQRREENTAGSQQGALPADALPAQPASPKPPRFPDPRPPGDGETAREYLATLGVGDPALTELAEAASAEDVHRAYAEAHRDWSVHGGRVKNPVRAMVGTLAKARGIHLARRRGPPLRENEQRAVDRLEARRKLLDRATELRLAGGTT